MPNHCEQDLTVRGPIADVDAFLTSCTKIDNDDTVLDCNAIIPYPQRYRDMDATAKLATDEWCVKNWGTKWGAYDGIPVRVTMRGKRKTARLSFSSAWEPIGSRIWNELTTRFPTLLFTLRYYEGGVGFQGEYAVKGTSIVREFKKPYRGQRGG